MLCYILTIISVLSKCNGIGIEYYDDRYSPEEHTEDFLKIISDSRRAGNETILYSNQSDNFFDYDINDYFKKRNTAKYNIRHDYLVNSSVFATKNETTLFDLSKIVVYNTTMHTTPKITLFPLYTLKEYDYMYEDDTKPNIVRQNIPKPTMEVTTNKSEPVKTSLTEFYNLEPAVQHLNLNDHHNYSSCNNLWYILEDLPCWNLPLLYGEFGRQKKTHEVFLIHGGEVKNVIEKDDSDKWNSSNRKERNIPLTYYTNKWCKTPPCYGDHTLCLFSDETMSGMCNVNYSVELPTIPQQIALINTLNSMRNKIANGHSDRYPHLPSAANMKQVIYDYDLENFARVWLHQCLPGPEPCSALDGTFVNQLECTKFAKYCCVKSFTSQSKKCSPNPECFTPAIVGCLHVWFWNAGDNLTVTDVQCGHSSISTYSTVQMLWATTYKIGCAYGHSSNGDIRVICNFSPGAPFNLDARYYCGLLSLKGGNEVPRGRNISDTKLLKSFGININQFIEKNQMEFINATRSQTSKLKLDAKTNVFWGLEMLQKIYTEGWIRKKLNDYTNGTRDMVARLVIKYKFIELNGARCDSGESIYAIGAPGASCVERGRRYQGLCYDFRDPTPGYRIVAVIAPIALFSLILYDLFSGVLRQTHF